METDPTPVTETCPAFTSAQLLSSFLPTLHASPSFFSFFFPFHLPPSFLPFFSFPFLFFPLPLAMNTSAVNCSSFNIYTFPPTSLEDEVFLAGNCIST